MDTQPGAGGLERPGHTAAHVVVVDDEPMIREICADILEDEGYAVSTAGNGREAVDLVTNDAADLVLMDIMMPVMDGISACRALQADARTRDIPIVVMSAAANLRLHAPDLGCGVAAVVPKPFDFDELLAIVARLVVPPGGGATAPVA